VTRTDTASTIRPADRRIDEDPMLRNLPIKKKGLIIVSAPLLLMVALLGTLYSIGDALERATTMTLHSQEVLGKIEAAAGGLVAIHGENLQLSLLGTSESAFELEDRREAVRIAARELQQMTADNEHQSRIVTRFVALADELLLDLTTTYTVLRAAPGERGNDGPTRAAADDRKLQQAIALTDDLKNEERRLAVERLEATNRLGRSRRWALLVGGGLTVLLACLVGGWAMASMVRRLLIIRENVARLATDEPLVPPAGGHDEIGQIDRAVHDMVRSLRAQRKDNEMFIYSVSHDLRSPLVNLQGFGKELEHAAAALRQITSDPAVPAAVSADARRVLDEDVDVALRYIDQAVQRQSRIIDSLLSLSRAGRVEYAWQAVDLGSAVQSIVEALRSQEQLAQIEFVVGDLPAVYGDADALERVFDNLIGNAVKYLSPQRRGRIEVGVHAQQGGSVVLFVRDNGIGIAREHLERAFLPFSRFAGGKGEGIGLSLVRRVVDRHHGRVWLDSEPDVGTTVFVALRAATVASGGG
jgi:signal transduction histidine kinase